MKLSPNVAHLIAIVLAAAGAVLHFLQVNPDIANEAHVTSNALITLGFIVALVSQSVFGTATPPTPSPLAPPSDAAKKVAGAVVTMLALGALCGTQQACKGSALPVFEQVVAVVEADLKNNVSDSQMASDVCQAMGGTATTDAVCAGVEVVIRDAVQLLIDSGVLSGNPLARAKSYMSDHPKTTVTVTAPVGGK